MTVWSSIKKFLNSSLGTNDFKALDKSLVGEWELKASDEIYYDIYADENIAGIKTKIFKAYIDGSVRIKAWYDCHILIYINDVLVVDKTELRFSQDISLSKGDILKIEIEKTSVGVNLQICATETRKAFLQE